MSERTVSVRLQALIDHYQQNMGKASKTTDDFAKKVDNWKTLGKRASDLGDSMTTRLTLPILALGGAAAKLSMDFNSSFDQMVALAGVSADEVDGLKESVLGLSETTGRGPQELAEALYFIRGAGLAGQTALDALEVSAKASAAGMGTTVEVADALTNVINAYGAANISAAQAGDILTASVTAAKVEASEMAPQFGRLLPVAAELGVEFSDVAGALAFLTVSSGDASQASTGLSGVLRKLLQPSQQGAAALEQIGLKAIDLRDMLGRKGLDGTIIELRERLGDAGFKELFDDSEALAAALQMTGASAEQFKDIMEDTGDSAGALDDAFKRTDNDSRKAQIAWAKAQGALIRLGDAIIPIVTLLADLASAAFGVLGDLPSGLQTTIVLLGAMVAAAGPLLSVFGRVTTTLATVSGWIEKSSLGTGRFGDLLSKLPAFARGAAIALGAIGVALAAIEVIAGQRESKTRGWVEDMIGDPGTLSEVRASIQDVKAELDELDDREGKGRLFSVAGANIFATGGDADRQERIDQLREKLGELEAQEEQLVGQEAETAAAYVGTDGALAGLNEETTNAVQELQNLSDALAAQFDPLFGMTDALVRNEEAQRAVTEAKAKLNEALASGTEEEVAAAQRDLDAAYREAAGSALDYEAAAAQLQAGIEAGTVSVEDAKTQLGKWVEQGLISQETADAMGRQFDIAALKALALGGTDPRVTITAQDFASTAIAGVQRMLDNLPRHVTVQVGMAMGAGVGAVLAAAGRRAAGGPVAGGRLYEVAENERSELLKMGGRTYLIPGADGQVEPAAMAASVAAPTVAAAPTGGGVTNIYTSHFDFTGAIITSKADAERWVADAWNRAAAGGRVHVNGRRV